MSDRAQGWVILIIFVVLVAALVVGGKTVKLDLDCTLHFGDGCVTGKPYRVVDDER